MTELSKFLTPITFVETAVKYIHALQQQRY